MDIDLDAILAKRAEETGSDGDTFTFSFAGRTWQMKDPMLADDDWKDELAELDLDIEVAEHYMGVDQYAEFREAGGKAGYAMLALKDYMEKVQDEAESGPTRRTRSSSRTQRRSKRR